MARREETEGDRLRRIAILNARLPKKRNIAQGMLRNAAGEVLLCELSYKLEWDLPGGVVDPGEPPAVTVVREIHEELGIEETAPTAIQGSQFAIDSIRFAEDQGTKLAVVQSHFTGGGPLWTVSLYYDGGSVPRYSYMFLGGSIVLFVAFLPLLDRAERKRKEFLTGGGAPAWYGPA